MKQTGLARELEAFPGYLHEQHLALLCQLTLQRRVPPAVPGPPMELLSGLTFYCTLPEDMLLVRLSLRLLPSIEQVPCTSCSGRQQILFEGGFRYHISSNSMPLSQAEEQKSSHLFGRRAGVS